MSIETLSAVTAEPEGISAAMTRIDEIRTQISSLNAPTFSLASGVISSTPVATVDDTTTSALPSTLLDSATSSTAPAESDSAVSTNATSGADLANYALKYLGTPYVWGGESLKEGGFDCSGLMQYVASHFGITLPRVAADQATAGEKVDKSKAKIGDLLFFDYSSSRSGIDHVAMYLGGGRMVQAPKPGDKVKVSQVPWDDVVTVRRIVSDAPATQSATAAASTTSTAPAGWESLLPSAGKQWADDIEWAAGKAGIDPRLLAALTRAESGFRSTAVSPAGAIGLTQLMPATAKGLGVNPSDPRQNLLGGARYLKAQLSRYDGNIAEALSAYNAGPGRVVKGHGVPNISETQNYVKTVTSYYRELGGRA